jgi:hypothetical protein
MTMTTVETDTTPTPAAPAVALLRVPGGRPDLDARLDDVIKPDTVLKMRLAPTFWPAGREQVVRWPGVTWLVAFAPGTDQHARLVRFREALDRFVREWVEGENG